VCGCVVYMCVVVALCVVLQVLVGVGGIDVYVGDMCIMCVL